MVSRYHVSLSYHARATTEAKLFNVRSDPLKYKFEFPANDLNFESDVAILKVETRHFSNSFKIERKPIFWRKLQNHSALSQYLKKFCSRQLSETRAFCFSLGFSSFFMQKNCHRRDGRLEFSNQLWTERSQVHFLLPSNCFPESLSL